jgi:hypothetical protein
MLKTIKKSRSTSLTCVLAVCASMVLCVGSLEAHRMNAALISPAEDQQLETKNVLYVFWLVQARPYVQTRPYVINKKEAKS